MDKLNVKVRWSNGTVTNVEVSNTWTIWQLKEVLCLNVRVEYQSEISADKVKIIFAGRALQNNKTIKDCHICNFSLVHAIFLQQDEKERDNDCSDLDLNIYYPAINFSPKGQVAIQNYVDGTLYFGYQLQPHFYAYCKSRCKAITFGKLRARCGKCKQSAVTLDRGPECWDDIVTFGKINGTCESDGDYSRTVIEFYFKCGSHPAEDDETVAPLYQIYTNTRDVDCLICNDKRDCIFVFTCQSRHVMCLYCFQDYCISKIGDRQFEFVEGIGYTLPCPVGCENSYIRDSHHFRILGEEKYERYHKFAAEEFTLSEGGVLCPAPDCGQGIIPDAGVNRIECSNKVGCGFVFCRLCLKAWHEGSCASLQSLIKDSSEQLQLYGIDPACAETAKWEYKTQATIQRITKPCPKCSTPTERNGGCMHITCTVSRCRFQWCWLCCKEWDNNCRDDHWFGLLYQ